MRLRSVSTDKPKNKKADKKSGFDSKITAVG